MNRTPGRAALVGVVVAVLAALGLAAPAQAAAGKLTGVVRGVTPGGPSAGEALVEARVVVWRKSGSSWEQDDEVYTSSTGKFTVSGLDPAATYRVEVPQHERYEFDEDTGETVTRFAGEFYDDKPTLALAVDLKVPSGGTKTLANAVVLTTGRTITGKVTGGAEGVEGVDVTAYRKDAGEWQNYSVTTADADGNYTLDALPATTLRVGFADQTSGRYLEEFYADQARVDDAIDVDLATSSKTGINATLAPAGRIIGHVTKAAGGADLPYATVQAERIIGEDFGDTYYTSTDEDGRYRLGGLPSGSYRVRVYESPYLEQWYSGAYVREEAAPVSATAGDVTPNIDFAMTLPATVSGKVTASKTGIEVDVSLLKKVGSDWEEVTADFPTTGQSFLLEDVPPGTYTVRFSAERIYAPEYWNNKFTPATATTFTVTSGQNKTGVNAALDVGGKITGTVTRPAGTTDNVSATIAAVDASTGEVVKEVTAPVRKGGGSVNYSIDGLRAGSYKVQFARASGSSSFVGQFFKSVGEATGIGSAASFDLALGGTKSAVNATAKTGATINGRVLTATGAPTNCFVLALPRDATLTTRTAFSSKVTGSFSIRGLSAGTYDLAVIDAYEGSKCTEDYDLYYDGDDSESHLTDSIEESNGVVVGATQNLTLSRPMYYPGVGDLQTFDSAAKPTITGTPAVGKKLTASTTAASPTADSVSYQWYYGTQTPISGATSSTFTVTSKQAGYPVFVRATFKKAGHVNLPTFSSSVKVGAHNTAKPTVTGTAKVGSTVSASKGTWGGSGWTYRYQWYRGTAAIRGATGSSYTLTSASKGTKISVRVTASKPGYGSATAASTGRTVS